MVLDVGAYKAALEVTVKWKTQCFVVVLDMTSFMTIDVMTLFDSHL